MAVCNSLRLILNSHSYFISPRMIFSDDIGSKSHRLQTDSIRASFKRSLLSAEMEWVAFAIKEMTSMAALTSFLCSNEGSNLFCKLSFARIVEVTKLIRLLDVWWPSVNPFLIWKDFLVLSYCLISFGTLTNLEMFGMSNLSVILLIISDFQDPSSQHCFATSANWPDMTGLVFVKTRLLLFISLKMSPVSSSTPWSLSFELASLTSEEIRNLWFSVTTGGLW